MKSIPERIGGKVEVDGTTGCWNWTGWKNHDGYAVIRLLINGVSKQYRAHRVAYECFVGKIPDNKQIDHLCRNRACVNPSHLEIVTTKENTLRGIGVTAINKNKTHCPKGHPYSGYNLLLLGDKKHPRRGCRQCDRERRRKSNPIRRWKPLGERKYPRCNGKAL